MGETEQMEYAGFWQRLGAYVIDGLIVGPVGRLLLFAACYIFGHFVLPIAIFINNTVFFLYRPWCHANWGKTLGKWCLRIRVIRLDGGALSWPQALLREIFFVPEFIFGLIAVGLVLRHSSEVGSYFAFKSLMTTFCHGQASLPFQILGVYVFVITVVQASFVILHPQHRALHDIIAGTIVVCDRKQQKEHGMPLEDMACLQCGAIVPKEKNACSACGWTYKGGS